VPLLRDRDVQASTAPATLIAGLRAAAVLAVLTLLAGLTRLPFLSHIAADEAYYLTVGRQWLEGSMPYAGAFDVKPPGLFALMALAESIFGPTLIASKALCIAASGAAAFGAYLIARRLAGEIAGLAAALLYTASSLALSRSNTNAELLMAPFAVSGILAALPAILDDRCASYRPLLVAGLWFGAAASIKQTAVFEAIPLLAVALLRSSAGWRGAAAFIAGTAAIPAAFALYYLASGQLGPLFTDAVLLALRRANAENSSRGLAWLEFLSAGVDFLPAAVLASLLWFKRHTLRAHPVHAGLALLAAWSGGALLGAVAAGGGLYFYYLPLLPPLCVAGGLYIGAVQGRAAGETRRYIYRTLTIAAALLYTLRVMAGISFPPAESRQAAEAAAAIIRNANLQPRSGILAADAGLYVYIAAGANPPGRIFHPRQLLCETGFPAASTALTDALDRKPSFVIAANPPLIRACEIPERRALLEARLASDYCRLPGAQTALSVYGLKEGGLCGQVQ
jgi:4-amino-4-deoxy-L-arabinose transferase-like glycosyltransferase